MTGCCNTPLECQGEELEGSECVHPVSFQGLPDQFSFNSTLDKDSVQCFVCLFVFWCFSVCLQKFPFHSEIDR